MSWRRSASTRAVPELEPAHRALAEGRIDAAVALLRDAAAASRSEATRALCQLHLASAASLHGEAGLDRGLQALRAAAGADPSAVRLPLYRALHWAFHAEQGASAHRVRRGVAGIDEGSGALPAYHAAVALHRAGAVRSALRLLQAVPAEALPRHLAWRRWSWIGRALLASDDAGGAADAFRRSVEEAPAGEVDAERIRHAHALFEHGAARRALGALDAVRDVEAVDAETRHLARDVRGRAELELGNPGRALEILDDAERDAPDAERRYETAHAAAQALIALGRHDAAADRIAAALAGAPDADRAHAHHERGVALLDADRPEDAAEALQEALLDPDYPHRADATADLAEAQLRTGDLNVAAETARRALDAGATGPACLVLGSVALEYYEMDDAVTWFEQAASASPAGDPIWLAAQQSLADVFAQRGPESAERLLTHARAALRYTEPSSEWTASLETYVARAREQLGGRDRTLN